ncbi:iron chaperone [Bacillus sp. KH172YL63]|uniref:iron chaperone n=1 Tax=Bacillus sp. KH172YL63 TaxID=2709784 RepID=UPI0013E4E498|nr:iron chaperone [Bacillus sp. KH172YL63]BCB02574.1 intracellular iron chaperone frataxin [Bacillus sp. KH172YL63]
MKAFTEYLSNIPDPHQQARTKEVLTWVADKYPNLVPKIAWNQPMFTDHGTFIIAFSISKKHLAVSPEKEGIVHFSDEIVKSGYDHTKMLMRIPWDRAVDYSLLEKMIEFNIAEKADCETFWRKS